MAHKLLSIFALFSLNENGIAFANDRECEWKMEYTGFPSEFTYYSSCNDLEYFSVEMVSLTEYTPVGPTINSIIFELYGNDWNWLWPDGDHDSFHGFDCLMNKYIGKLYTLIGNNCLMNITTYLFEEMAEINIYNFTRRIVDKYTLKWDFEIDYWPWLFSTDYLLLCMKFKTNIGGVTNITENIMWLNFTVAKHFEVAIPKIFTCNGVIDNIQVAMDYGGILVDICVNIPYCNGAIYFDPIVNGAQTHAES
eukprot:219753_1